VKALGVLALGSMIATIALARTNEVKIPKQGWTISFDSPPLTHTHNEREGGDFSFMADSGPLIISFYVEKPRGAGDSHKACFEFYWSRSDQDPYLQKNTVSISETDTFVRVQYDSVSTVQGYTIRAKNVRYFFAFHGKWVDVHISTPATERDGESLIATFDKSLTYGP
jgi:hypothetical protein